MNKIKPFYSTVIIGGGIVGAGIFRDLSLHGVDTLLIDKGDFCSQTSQRSSKMLHGGIRYLETLDFKLVWEALHEKNLWKQLLPTLCKEEAFHLPIYQEVSKYPLSLTKVALLLYDLLSNFKNTPHQIISKKESLKKIPAFTPKGLKGCGIYYDVVMDDLKLGLEIIFNALDNNKDCEAVNHVEITSLEKNDGVFSLTLKDNLTGDKTEVNATSVVFAVGPFTDTLLKKLDFCLWEDKLLPSKGIHVWIDKESLNVDKPVVLQTKDGRILFVIPHEDAILAGTTESEPEKEFFDIEANEEEINYIIENINKYFTNSISRKDIISSFAGVRPLVCDQDSSLNRGKASREHKVYYPMENIYVIAGGKYTTFRVMGQEISKSIVNKLNRSYNSNKTLASFSPRSIMQVSPKILPTDSELNDIIENEKVRTKDDLFQRRLAIYSPKHWKFENTFEEFIQEKKKLIKETKVF